MKTIILVILLTTVVVGSALAEQIGTYTIVNNQGELMFAERENWPDSNITLRPGETFQFTTDYPEVGPNKSYNIYIEYPAGKASEVLIDGEKCKIMKTYPVGEAITSWPEMYHDIRCDHPVTWYSVKPKNPAGNKPVVIKIKNGGKADLEIKIPFSWSTLWLHS